MALGYTERRQQLRMVETRLTDHRLSLDLAVSDARTLEAQLGLLGSGGHQDGPAFVRTLQDKYRRASAPKEIRERYITTIDRIRRLEIRIAELVAERERIRQELASVEPPRARLTAHPPARLVAAEDVGVLAADLELLLVLADRFIDDSTQPPDLRAAVETRARTLRGELRLFGDEPHDAIIITRSAAYLIATLTPGVIEAAGDQLPVEGKAALDAVAEGSQSLGDDDTAVDGATAIAGALDQPDATTPDSDQPYRHAARRGLANWIEHDLFTTHLNRVVGAGITAAGIAGIEATTGAASAILRAGRALLRARFPWIFT